MRNQPPNMLRWLFRLMCPPERRAEIEGDFLEIYQENVKSRGRRKAVMLHFINIISLLNFSSYLRQLKLLNNITMLKLIFRSRFRSMLKFRFSAIVGMLTLALGAVTTGFLFYYVSYEYSYDAFHDDADLIYRVNTISKNDRQEISQRAFVPVPAGAQFVKDFDEVMDFTRVQKLEPTVIYKNKAFQETRFFLTDNSYFHIFSQRILTGNENTPLSEPQTVVITESTARKYFGDQDPVGEVIEVNLKKSFRYNFTQKQFTITAVMEDSPQNTHLKVDFLASLSTLGDFRQNDWLGGIATYIKVKPDHQPDLLNSKFGPLIRENLGPYLQARFKMSFDDYLAAGRAIDYQIQPVTEIHTTSEFDGEFEHPVQGSFLKILISLGLLIFLLTSVNYFNIAMANGLSRFKEIGIRKSMGALKYQLTFLFLGESIALAIFSLGLAAILIIIANPMLQAFIPNLPANFEISGRLIGWVCLASLVISFLSGTFIAMSLSRVPLLNGLKGNLLNGHRGIGIQKVLLGLQFFVAFATIMAAGIFQAQNNYLLEADLGFDQDNIVVIRNIEKTDAGQRQVLMNGWQGLPQVVSASFSNAKPGDGFEMLEFTRKGFGDTQEKLLFSMVGSDSRFLETYRINLIQGEEGAIERDSANIVINESAMNAMGFVNSAEAIGKKLLFYGKELAVAGLTPDFHHENLYKEIGPLVMMSPEALPEAPLNPYKYASIRLAKEDIETIQKLESSWKQIQPSAPFDFEYLKDGLKRSYTTEQLLGKMVQGANIVAVLVALLGLISMSQVIFRVKVKEIAMRKVLGATNIKLYQLFVHQFFWPLFIAFLCALPLVIRFLGDWLNKFAYRITMGWQLLAFSGLGLILLALGILTINALRAARQNPAKYIRVDH